eukprot:TRINITY_DN4443_c0_g1_i3.p2 TRINITY_DN4443_c0_g1~~TRINITY_DN4443_c0_g1_i3.p2  ORF type:complete len:188 (-),score=48.60 TRINITY_DN4443_c0_g1_i3:165-728(-)
MLVKDIMEKINEYAMKRNFIRGASEKTGVPGGYILIGLVLLILVLLYSGIGTFFALLILAFLYPAYLTFKALKYSNQELLVRIGKFWTVMGFAVALHRVIEWLAPEIPLFELATIVCSFILIKSQAAGAVYVYETLILPCLGKLESSVDGALTHVEETVNKEKDGLADITDKVKETAGDIASKVKFS